MAEIVLGMGTPHSPQLSTPPELWGEHARRDMNNPALHARDGQVYTYEQLLDLADPALERELTAAKFAARYEACQQGIAGLSAAFGAARLDALIIMGNDQQEQFHDDNMPALAAYWGETIRNVPPALGEDAPASRKASAWGWAADREIDYPVQHRLGLHIIEQLMEAQFDVAHTRRLPDGMGMAHAFGFVYQRIMAPQGAAAQTPTVPLMINTYYPPNQVTPQRCYEFGRAVRQAVESWDGDLRVGVIASGGLSHFVVDEELDRTAIEAFRKGDGDTLRNLPRERLNSGNSEIRNWIAAAGAAEHLTARTLDYVPCYRSPAGTGCGMGFVAWE